MNFGVLWCTLVYFWGVLWCTTMDYGVLLRCTSVYFSVLQWTKVYFGVQQGTSEKFSKIQQNSAPLLATIPDCDALSEVSTGRFWQLVLFSFCLCLLVLSLSSSYTFTWWQIIFVLCIFFLSYSPSVTFDIQSGFAICVFCYHVFPLPLRIARFPVVCSYSCVWDSLSRVLLSHPVVALLIYGQPSTSRFVFTSFFRAMSYTIFRCKVSDSGARQGHTSCFARKKSK